MYSEKHYDIGGKKFLSEWNFRAPTFKTLPFKIAKEIQENLESLKRPENIRVMKKRVLNVGTKTTNRF